MKVSSGNKPVQTLVNSVNRGNIVLEHKLQRREGVWNKFHKSLLVDSLLRGYIVNPIHTISEDKKQYVIDGVQRLSTLRDYLADKFTLSKALNDVEIDGTVYQIAGKKFSKLDDPVKDLLNSSQVQVYEITQYTDKDVREMFSRLNSGIPLNAVQKMTPKMSEELRGVIFDIESHNFFDKFLTDAQSKSSIGQSVVLEVLMLSESGGEYDFGSFRKNDKEKFIEYYNEKINADKVAVIKQALDLLDEAFGEGVKIHKTTISFVIYAVYKAIKDKRGTAKVLAAIKQFLDTYETNEEYKSLITQGTSAGDSVKKRQEYWNKIARTS